MASVTIYFFAYLISYLHHTQAYTLAYTMAARIMVQGNVTKRPSL